MNLYATKFTAICATSGKLKDYGGPHVQGITLDDAQAWCQINAGHLVVLGRVLSETPCKEGSCEPDFANRIDYDKQKLN